MKARISSQPSDRAVEDLRFALAAGDKGAISLSREVASWLLAEIDGGREAFGALVEKIRILSESLAQLQSNHAATLNVLSRLRNGERIG